MSRTSHGLAVALVLASSLCACDPRAPEPTVTRDSTEAKGQSEPAQTTTTPSRPILPNRCLKETPAEPTRTVTGPVPAPGCPADPGPVPELVRKRVEIRGASEGLLTVDAEIAKEDEHRMRGLMYRTSLPENDGMLFIFEYDRELNFWMRNTCIPLDMMFIAADGTIVAIEENTPTLTDETFSSGCNARYVLEVNAGWSRKHGVKAGMKVKVPKA
ncbi:MAG: DUF192 domain-containing protein [Polyangiaceae bacterium]|nr:DUF192 domain-containing protein [Polyangiaceae bacterium]